MVCISSPHHQTKLSVHACSSARTFRNAASPRNWKSVGVFCGAPQKPGAAETSQRNVRQSHKMADSSQAAGAANATRVRSCPKKCQLGAAKEPPVSSYLLLRRVSHGAICSIKTPAVIKTVLRQPMAWKRLRRRRRRGQREEGKVAALAVHTSLFQLPFCASHNT